MNTKKFLNIAAFALVMIASFLKANHLIGGSIAGPLSVIAMLASLFMFAVKDNKEAGMSDGLNYFLIGTVTFWIIGTTFKFYHWAGSEIFVYVGCALAVILPIILMVQKDDFKVSKQFIITFFTYFLLLLAILSHSPLITMLRGGSEMPTSENAVPSMQNDSANAVTSMDK